MRDTWSAWQLKDSQGNLVDLYTNKPASRIVNSYGICYTRGPLRIWWEDEEHPNLIENELNRYIFEYANDNNSSSIDYLKEIWVSNLFKR